MKKQVKIQDSWLDVDQWHFYGDGSVWYGLASNAGCGWTDFRNVRTIDGGGSINDNGVAIARQYGVTID